MQDTITLARLLYRDVLDYMTPTDIGLAGVKFVIIFSDQDDSSPKISIRSYSDNTTIRTAQVLAITKFINMCVAKGYWSQVVGRHAINYFHPKYERGDDPIVAQSMVQEFQQSIHKAKQSYHCPHLFQALTALGKNTDYITTLLDKYRYLDEHSQLVLDHLSLRWYVKTKNPTKGQMGNHPKQKMAPLRPNEYGDTSLDVRWRLRWLDKFVHNIMTLGSITTPSQTERVEIGNFLTNDQQIEAALIERAWIAAHLGSYWGVKYLTQARNPLYTLGMVPQIAGLKLDKREHAFGVSYVVRLRKACGARWFKPLRRLFPPPSDTDEAHMITRVDGIINNLIHGSEAVRLLNGTEYAGSLNTVQKRLSHMNHILNMIAIGTNQVLTMTIVINMFASPNYWLSQKNLGTTHLMHLNIDQQHDLLKQLGTLARKCSVDGFGSPLDVAGVGSLAYLDMAFGRSKNTSDWEAERRNRCFTSHHIQLPSAHRFNQRLQWVAEPATLGNNTIPDNNFYSKLGVVLRRIVYPLINEKVVRESWPDFVSRRHEWVASGSSGGHKVDYKDLGVDKEGKVSVNKRIWAETITQQELVSYLHTAKPKEHAKASEKYENGKSRAIYGVDPWHYSINTYVTQGMEERLFKVEGLEKGSSGCVELGFNALRLKQTTLPGIECTMLDFADFNIHHTPRAQAILFQAIRSTGRQKSCHQDWLQACDWLIAAKYNQLVTFPGKQNADKVTQGMFSGTRSTDLINTLLNLAYFTIASEELAKAGIHHSDLYHVHQGDDVWLSNSNKIWAQALYSYMVDQGFIFQPAKQMFGHGRGEFLRVLYHEGTGRGYPNRSIINYILKPLQSRLNVDATAWIKSITSTMRVLGRRGICLYTCNRLWYDAINFWGKVIAHKEDKRPISLPREYIYGPPEQGGLGCPPPGYGWVGKEVPTMPIYKPNISSNKGMQVAIPQNMSKDWVVYVSKKGYGKSRRFDSTALTQSIAAENVAPLRQNLLRDKGLTEYKDKVSRVAKQLNSSISKRSRYATTVCTPDLKAATNAIETWFEKNQYVSSDACNDWVRLQINHACLHPTDAEPLDLLSDTIAKHLARNRFKSETRAAQAYHITKYQAISLVLHEATMDQQTELSPLWVVDYLITHNLFTLLDQLMSGGSSLYDNLQFWVDAGFMNYIVNSLHQKLIKGAIYSNNKLTGPNWFNKRGSYATAYIKQALASQYPSTQLLY